ncbi:MAG: hypothetical protein SF070_15850 [Gemmatimonadota bacterium]|nr:hypothetical protein [Gemmatimonadota bacterium]
MDVGNIFRRLRGALGLAVAWGVCWSAVTLVVHVALALVGDGFSWSETWRAAVRNGVVGGMASVAFSVVIGWLYRGRRLSEISWVRFGAGGAIVAGLALPAIMFVGRTISGDGPLPMEKWIASALLAAAFGGVAAGATMKLAQHGPSRLKGGSQDQLDGPEGSDRLESGDR